MARITRVGFAAAFIAVGVLAVAIPPVAFAQGCVLCYQSAAAAGSHAIHALRSGIVILIFPPFFICLGISYLVYCRRNVHNDVS